MVLDSFALRPPEADEPDTDEEIDDPANEADVDDDSADTDSEAPDGADDGEDTADQSDSKPPSDPVADLASITTDLRRSVGRGQRAADQLKQDPANEQLRKDLRDATRSNAALADAILAIDPALVDAETRARVSRLRDESQAAESAAQRKDELDAALKEHGIGQQGDDDREAQLAELNQRGVDIEDAVTIAAEAAGVDPNTLNWDAGKQALLAGHSNRDIIRAFGQAIKAAAENAESDPAADRRDKRAESASSTPQGSTPTADKDPLNTGTLDDKVGALRAIGAL